MIELITRDAQATERVAEQIGARLRGGEIIELISDLGGGKTTFARGLARGAGSLDQVASPSFALSRNYRATAFDILHFDFYRLLSAGILEHAVRDDARDKKTVLVVEWAKAVRHVLPKERLIIRLLSVGENERRLKIKFPARLKYLVEGL